MLTGARQALGMLSTALVYLGFRYGAKSPSDW